MTEVPHGITARQLIRALHADGFRLTRTRGGRRVVVAHHRLGETFPIGTLKGMIADIGWFDEDLRRLGLAGS